MEISRQKYLDRLIAHKGNKRVKIVTGIRRCGKSYLLFVLFKRHLVESGVKPSHIIEIQLDDRMNQKLRNPDNCLAFIHKKIKDDKPYYLLYTFALSISRNFGQRKIRWISIPLGMSMSRLVACPTAY